MKIHYIDGEVAHGIHIKEFKKTNWKYVYNHGYIMRLYKQCPKIIHFESEMANDLNQHLCGGWRFDRIDEDELTFNQIINKKKPFAFLAFWEEEKQKAYEFKERFESLGFINQIQERNNHGKKMTDLLVCQDIKIEDIGNFEDLKEDYANGVHINFPNHMEKFRNCYLKEFFGGWDEDHGTPTWITGLILGYPIENTISIYLQ